MRHEARNIRGALTFALPVRMMLSSLSRGGAWCVWAPPRVGPLERILAFFLLSSIMPDHCSRQATAMAVTRIEFVSERQ
jgi:hypothetical protein